LPNKKQTRRQLMKKWVAVLLALPLLGVAGLRAQTTVGSFEDIQFWAGSGAKRAALVLEFANGSARWSIAWGYRWDGEAVMQDMLFSLAGSITGSAEAPPPGSLSDPRLAVDVGFFEGFGFFVNTLTYNPVGLGGSWPTGELSITNDFFGDGTYPAIYLRPGNGTWSDDPFVFSPFDGIPTLALEDGGWFGTVQNQGDEEYVFAQPLAAPSGERPPGVAPSLGITMQNGVPVIRFPFNEAYTYQLQFSSSLSPAHWHDLGAPVSESGPGGWAEIVDNSPDLPAQRFYQVVVR
jgi:hypothetical protein